MGYVNIDLHLTTCKGSSFKLYGLSLFATFDEWIEHKVEVAYIMVVLEVIHGTSHVYHHFRVLL